MESLHASSCPNVTVLQQYLGRDLSHEDASGVDAHVEACAACQEILDDLIDHQSRFRSLKRLLRGRAGGHLGTHAAANQTAVASPVEPVAPPASIGGFRVLAELGSGSYGVVYHAHDDALNRPVAIKVPRGEVVQAVGGIEMYLKEARMLASLDHAHIVRVYEAKADGWDSCYIVSQYIAGQSLAARLKAGPLEPLAAARILAPLADALQHAHERGVWHRDVKPANILVDASGKPYLADFGLALSEDEIGSGPRFLGTPAYMSPEQARGEGNCVDGRTDIFSLGVVFYEMLTGKRPFLAKSADELLRLIVQCDAPSARQKDRRIPGELDRICAKALARNLSDRYGAASDLANDLYAWMEAERAKSNRRLGLRNSSATVRNDSPHDLAEPQGSERVIGGFQLRARLGSGGMGIVYRAWQPSEDRDVALKCLRVEDDTAQCRFLTEIRALGKVEHPNLVRIYTSGADGDRLFYAMELIEGAGLGDLLRRLPRLTDSQASALDDDGWLDLVRRTADETRAQEQPLVGMAAETLVDLPEEADSSGDDWETARSAAWQSPAYVRRVAAIVRDVALAAQALHDQGIVHRDIKPDNVLLTREGNRAVLMDLGIAKLAADDTGCVTRTREFVGSLRYASPEQILDAGEVDHRSDVYSLGATLWELLTLRPIYGIRADMRDAQAMLKIEIEEPEPVRKYNLAAPKDLQAIVQCCLEKHPDRRYASAAALAEDLERFLQSQPVQARPVGPLARLARRCQRRPLVPGLTALVALLGMALLAAIVPPSVLDTNEIRVGIKPWVGFSPLVVAAELKLCEGVDLTLVPVRNTTDVRQRILSHELDAAPYLVDSHALARASRTPTKVVLQLDVSLEADAIVAVADVRTFGDIQGKRVAYMHQEAPDFLLLSLCERFNVDPNTFHHEKTETAKEAVELFLAGKADVVVTYEPFLQLALNQPGAHRLASAADDPGAIIDILAVREDFLETDRPKVEALIDGWMKAVALLERGDPAAVAIACRFLGTENQPITPPEYYEMARGMKYAAQEDNLRFFHQTTADSSEFRRRFDAAQRRWHRHHQIIRQTEPKDGDGSHVLLDMYGGK